MKVALLYHTFKDKTSWGAAFHEQGVSMDQWHYPMDPDIRLPVGTRVEMVDKATDTFVDFVVTEWRYLSDDRFLRLEVVTGDEIEITPEEFVRYVQENWVPGSKIDEWVKMP